MQYYRILLALLFVPILGSAQVVPEGFNYSIYQSGIDQPTQMTQAPDGRIFIAERTGGIRIIENGELLDEPFYTVETETPGERGVTGLQLHPDFDQNGYVYIHYTKPDANQNRIIRVQATGNTASVETEEEIFLLDPMWAAWHNGGGMVFDSSGKMFLGVGDGTGWNWADSTSVTLGKILRLNDDGSIPQDNPFYNEYSGNSRAIWARGIRNPYTMAIQESSGRILFNDVGNEAWEEVNEVVEAAHYGWGDIEGPVEPGQPTPDNYQDPIYSYGHDEGCAILGADFYEPELAIFPEEYHNKYFFLEHCVGKLFYLDISQANPDPVLIASGLQFPNNLLVLDDGSLLLSEVFNNRIMRLWYTGSGAPYVVEQSGDQLLVPGDELQLYVNAQAAQSMSYQWYRDGQMIDGAQESTLTMMLVDLSFNNSIFSCEISSQAGAIDSNDILVTVIDETRPVAEITGPLNQSSYRAGDTLFFAGNGFDSQDGELGPSSFTWDIYFHHNVHRHNALTDLTAVTEGYYVIPKSGEVSEDVWFSVELKVQDSAGLTSTDRVEVHPQIVSITLDTSPRDIVIRIDGAEFEDGTVIESVAKMNRSLLAEQFVITQDQLFQFNQWKEGVEDLAYTVEAADTTISPQYESLHPYTEGNDSEDLIVTYYSGIDDERVLVLQDRVSQINENWNAKEPEIESDMPSDEFSITYEGSIFAPYTGDYVIYTLHDSRVKLTILDSLMIDTDHNEHIKKDSIMVTLEAGERYNFLLDYTHEILFSRIELSWRFSALPEHTIPSKQLYLPIKIFEGKGIFDNVLFYPNPASGPITMDLGEVWYTWVTESGRIEVFDAIGRQVSYEILDNSNGFQKIEIQGSGRYSVRISLRDESRTVPIILE